MGETAVLGFDEQVIEIMEKLVGDQSSRVVLPIVGMGGIGKTTLARAVYENRLVVEYFDIRIWVIVSQDYSIKAILLQALNAIDPKDKCDSSKSEEELALQLHKSLFGRRYLVVMDDIWSVEAWEKISRFFPTSENGNRILITSRLSNMGDYFDSGAFKMQFLDDDKSWNLFCVKALGSQNYPPEFEEIGKKIVGKCRGLPLSIVVIGGLLAKSARTQQYWESVEEDMNSLLSSANDEQFLNILSLSYHHLPQYLKPCFLYMGILEEDQYIRASKLIKLWVAEGFLKPNEEKCKEEVGMDYLRDLIDRSLIMDNRGRACSTHDLLRQVSIRIAQKEKFFSVISMHIVPYKKADDFFKAQSKGKGKKKKPWYEGNEDVVATRARYFLCYNYQDPIVYNDEFQTERGRNIAYSTELFQYKLLGFPYLDFFLFGWEEVKCLIPLLYNFWNLQTLIFTVNLRDTNYISALDMALNRVPIRKEINYPTLNIWKMPQIRHIIGRKFRLPDLSVTNEDESVLENLQTLRTVENFRWTEQVLKRIPNIIFLEIQYVGYIWSCDQYCLNNVSRFSKLETLICRFYCENWGRVEHNLAFPPSLKKLELIGCSLDAKDLKLIGELPDLEFFFLLSCEFVESEWKIVDEGEFQSLKRFRIVNSAPTGWIVDRSQNLPVLQMFSLENAKELSEIPNDIADIPTLKLIYLIECSVAVVVSAVKMVDEQLSLGNEDLQVKAYLYDDEDKNRLREIVGNEALERCQTNFEFLKRYSLESPWIWELDEDEDEDKGEDKGEDDT